MNMKKIAMALQIAWYGIQLAKEVKEVYQWYKKRVDDKTPTPNNISEKEAATSNSDIITGNITVENSPGCNINVGHQLNKNNKTDEPDK